MNRSVHLLQIIWNTDPEIFKIGGFSLRYYSLLFVVAFVLGFLLMKKMYQREGLGEPQLNPLVIYVIAGTIIGARLGQVLFYEFGYYKNHLAEMVLPFRISNGKFEWTGYRGLASHGGAIGILTAVWLYARKYKVPMLWVLDRLVIAVALGGFFIRLGNFFNSEILGQLSTLPWAVVFTKVDLVPRHPAQLYEALAYLAIFGVLWLLYRNEKAQKRGLLFGWFLVLVFTARFLIEFVKADQEAFESRLLLNMGQLLSLPFVLAGLYFLLRKGSAARPVAEASNKVNTV